jgi:hypothetical protein
MSVIDVYPPPTMKYKVNKVVLNLTTATIPLSGTVQLTATAKDSNNNTVNGVNFFWESRSTLAVSVSQSGLVTGYSGRVPAGHTKNVGGLAHIYAYAKRDDGSIDTAFAMATITVLGQ